MFKYFFTPEVFLPEGVGFQLFGMEHLCWLGVLCGMCVVMICTYRKLNIEKRTGMARFFAYSLLILEILRDIYLIACGAWKWEYLPLHPCSFTSFFMALWSWKKNPLWGDLMYGYGLVGAFCALMFCNWTNQPVWNFQCIYSFFFHGVLVGWILMVMIGGDIRPQRNGFLHCVEFLLVAVPLTAIVNNTLPDCNFFFTYSGSEGSPLELLINLFGHPWWLVAYASLALVVLGAEFIPWVVADKKRAKIAI